MSVMDIFTFVLKPDDKGVVKKLDEVNIKAKEVNKSAEAIGDGFKELGGELTSALNAAIPGSDKLISNLQRIGSAAKAAFSGGGQLSQGMSRLRLRGGGTAGLTPGVAGSAGGGSGVPAVPANAAAGGGAAVNAAGAAGAIALGTAAAAAAAALAVLAIGAGVMIKAFLDGAETLSKSRKAAVDAGVNNTQMAAVEQFAKSMKLDKTVAQDALKEIAKTTQEGWVKSRERGNIFGIGNEQTQMLKKYGIRTSDSNGGLRNSAAVFEDIGKKMQGMSRESAIAFGQFFGMTKDFAAGVYDSKQSLSEFANANKESIAAQAEAMAASKEYEKAQQALANAWDDFAVQVGGKVLPVVTDVLETIVEAVPDVMRFGAAIKGQIMLVRDTAEAVFDWLKGKANDLVDMLPGASIIKSLIGEATDGAGNAASGASEAFNKGIDALAAYGRKNDKPTDQASFERQMKANTSLNAAAAKVQLEAANLMKTATAKFGLSTEQYMAMWAATSGKSSGLRSGGGLTTAGFRDAYKDVTSQYASPEAAVWMYGRGQPMMQQLPQQYAMGMGVNQYGMPSNPKGLGRAAEAVRETSAPVGPAASPFGGDRSKGRNGGGNTVDVTMGDIHINTKSTDPEEINAAVTGGMMSNLKFAMSKLGSGEVA